MQRILIAGVVLCAMITFCSSSLIPENAGPGNVIGLNLLSVTPNKIEGEYYGKDGAGIYFYSALNDEYYYLHISTTEGQPIFLVKEPRTPDSVSFVSILGTQFVMSGNYSSGEDVYEFNVPYSVPNDYKQQVENAIDENSFQTDLLQYLDQENAEKEERTAFTSLLQHPEIKLIRDAARALANVQGTKTDAASIFYDIAMQLKIAKREYHKLLVGATARRGRRSRVRIRVTVRVGPVTVSIEVEF